MAWYVWHFHHVRHLATFTSQVEPTHLVIKHCSIEYTSSCFLLSMNTSHKIYPNFSFCHGRRKVIEVMWRNFTYNKRSKVYKKSRCGIIERLPTSRLTVILPIKGIPNSILRFLIKKLNKLAKLLLCITLFHIIENRRVLKQILLQKPYQTGFSHHC